MLGCPLSAISGHGALFDHLVGDGKHRLRIWRPSNSLVAVAIGYLELATRPLQTDKCWSVECLLRLKADIPTRSFNVRFWGNSGDWPDFEGETLKTVFSARSRSRF